MILVQILTCDDSDNFDKALTNNVFLLLSASGQKLSIWIILEGDTKEHWSLFSLMIHCFHWSWNECLFFRYQCVMESAAWTVDWLRNRLVTRRQSVFHSHSAGVSSALSRVNMIWYMIWYDMIWQTLWVWAVLKSYTTTAVVHWRQRFCVQHQVETSVFWRR